MRAAEAHFDEEGQLLDAEAASDGVEALLKVADALGLGGIHSRAWCG
jgi:hypothetical protein